MSCGTLGTTDGNGYPVSPDKNVALSAVLERLPIATVISDVTTGVLLWANSRNMQILAGVASPEHLIGRSLLGFIEPAQQAIALRDIEAIARGQSPAPVVYHFRRLDGGAADVQIMSVPLRYGETPARC